jgi:Na+-driven multidrug efflux pump
LNGLDTAYTGGSTLKPNGKAKIMSKKIALNTSNKALLQMALPLCMGAFVQFIVVLVDNYFVAQLNGKAMSAVSFVGLIYIALAMLSAGLSNASQILIARKRGEGRSEEIPTVFANALFIGAFIVVIQFLVLAFFIPTFLDRSIEDEETRNYMKTFAETRAYGFIFFTFIQVLQSFWSGIALTRSMIYSTLTVALFTIVFDYLFIFGNFNFPRMEVRGAAIATNIGEAAAAIVLFVYTIFHAKYKEVRLFRNLYRVAFIEKKGDDSFQSAFIVRNMYMLAWVSVMGFSSTTKTYVSGLLAEKRSHEIFHVIKKLALLNFSFILLLTHGLWLYPESIAHLFNANAETTRLTVKSMYIVLPAISIFAITSILLAAVEGAGKTIQGFFIELGTTVLYLSYAFYIAFYTDADVAIIWTSDYVYFLGLGLFSMLVFRNTSWFKKTPRKDFHNG